MEGCTDLSWPLLAGWVYDWISGCMFHNPTVFDQFRTLYIPISSSTSHRIYFFMIRSRATGKLWRQDEKDIMPFELWISMYLLQETF